MSPPPLLEPAHNERGAGGARGGGGGGTSLPPVGARGRMADVPSATDPTAYGPAAAKGASVLPLPRIAPAGGGAEGGVHGAAGAGMTLARARALLADNPLAGPAAPSGRHRRQLRGARSLALPHAGGRARTGAASPERRAVSTGAGGADELDRSRSPGRSRSPPDHEHPAAEPRARARADAHAPSPTRRRRGGGGVGGGGGGGHGLGGGVRTRVRPGAARARASRRGAPNVSSAPAMLPAARDDGAARVNDDGGQPDERRTHPDSAEAAPGAEEAARGAGEAHAGPAARDAAVADADAERAAGAPAGAPQATAAALDAAPAATPAAAAEGAGAEAAGAGAGARAVVGPPLAEPAEAAVPPLSPAAPPPAARAPSPGAAAAAAAEPKPPPPPPAAGKAALAQGRGSGRRRRVPGASPAVARQPPQQRSARKPRRASLAAAASAGRGERGTAAAAVAAAAAAAAAVAEGGGGDDGGRGAAVGADAPRSSPPSSPPPARPAGPSPGGLAAGAEEVSVNLLYAMGRQLGTGSYGAVRLGVHRLSGCEVAIKCLRRQALSNARLRHRAEMEWRLQAWLDHPNIVKVLHVRETSSHLYIVQEIVRGGSLAAYLDGRGGAVPEGDAASILVQAAAALCYCHAHAVCHRDVKLDNVLLDYWGRCALTDFGLAVRVAEGSELTMPCGSLLYNAPEILRGKPYDGRKADVWAFGVMTYALATGAFPFDGGSVHLLRQRVCRGKFKLPARASAELASLLRGALAVDPARRLSMAQLLRHPWFVKNADPTLSVSAHGRPARAGSSGGVDVDAAVAEIVSRAARGGDEGGPFEFSAQQLLPPRMVAAAGPAADAGAVGGGADAGGAAADAPAAAAPQGEEKPADGSAGRAPPREPGPAEPAPGGATLTAEAVGAAVRAPVVGYVRAAHALLLRRWEHEAEWGPLEAPQYEGAAAHAQHTAAPEAAAAGPAPLEAPQDERTSAHGQHADAAGPEAAAGAARDEAVAQPQPQPPPPDAANAAAPPHEPPHEPPPTDADRPGAAQAGTATHPPGGEQDGEADADGPAGGAVTDGEEGDAPQPPPPPHAPPPDSAAEPDDGNDDAAGSVGGGGSGD